MSKTEPPLALIISTADNDRPASCWREVAARRCRSCGSDRAVVLPYLGMGWTETICFGCSTMLSRAREIAHLRAKQKVDDWFERWSDYA